MQRHSQVIRWQPKTLCDALDGSNGPQGGMSALSNLVPDQATVGWWQARPAATLINALSGFTPGYISAGRVVGDILYGMISGPGGLDFPFGLVLSSGVIITVTGVQNNTTLPATMSRTTNIPPQMDVIGTKLMVAHNGFFPTATAAGNFVGWFDLTNPFAPVWHAGQLTGGFITFTVPPIAVKQFANRAYYIHNAGQPAVIFSDVLNATNCLNANQILTFGDTAALSAMGLLPLSTLLGGQLQGLLVFKGTTQIYQITGDAALGNLTLNQLNIATGCVAPNTIVGTPLGLMFMSPDGVRMIDMSARVSDPIGDDGQGISVPFVQNVTGSACAAYAGNVFRISVARRVSGVNVYSEYWLHLPEKAWSGPHSFPASVIFQYNNTTANNETFVMQRAPDAFPTIRGIFQSDYEQRFGSSTFIEPIAAGGTALITCQANTVLLPDSELMDNICVTESTLDARVPLAGSTFLISVVDQDGDFLAQNIGITAGKTDAVQPYQIPWPNPLVFARASVQIQCAASLNLSIGATRHRYQQLRSYQNTVVSVGQTAQAYTFDPLAVGIHAGLSGSNLVVTADGTANNSCTKTTVSASSGRFYAEFKLTVADLASGNSGVGIATSSLNLNSALGALATEWGYYSDGSVFNNNVLVLTLPAYNTLNNVIMIAVSLTDGYLWFGINGAWLSGNPVTSTSPAITMPTGVDRFLAVKVRQSAQWTANFGGSAFAFTPPQGFQAWNAINE